MPDAFAAALDILCPPVDPDAWTSLARPEQLEPDGDWNIWLILAGRGYGKTRTGAETIVGWALANPGKHWAVIAPTSGDVRSTCLEGPSGILQALDLTVSSAAYNRTFGEVTLPNGSVIHGYSAEKPDRVRGPNLAGAWCDEPGSWRFLETWYEGLIPALRIGTNPRAIVTGTPRPTRLIRDLTSRTDGSVHVTRGSTFDNAANLSEAALLELRRRYEGTRLGRQELYGELLTDVPGALWQLDQIEADRVTEPPHLTRIVVAIDPAVTSNEDSDESGIVVAGIGTDGHAYVLADRSMRGTPDQWARRAVEAYHEYQADRIIGEANNGGDMIETVVRSVDPNVSYRKVTASRGKHTRAEPISALYEQHRVHHVGMLADLEDQMVSWLPEDPKSPDRMDALVWAVTELIPNAGQGAAFLEAWRTQTDTSTEAAAAPSCRCIRGVRRIRGGLCLVCGETVAISA